jgi:hypothetical protein
MDEKLLGSLYGTPDDCPGTYRVVHKLPGLPADLALHGEIDRVVAERLVSHDDFVSDIGRLTARALRQVHGDALDASPQALRGMAGQVATSLAVALLRTQALESAIATALVEQGAFGRAYISCPE